MTLIDRACHLLTCDELRGRLPDEVAEFLREVVALEQKGWAHADGRIITMRDKTQMVKSEFQHIAQVAQRFSLPLYTLETPHDR